MLERRARLGVAADRVQPAAPDEVASSGRAQQSARPATTKIEYGSQSIEPPPSVCTIGGMPGIERPVRRPEREPAHDAELASVTMNGCGTRPSTKTRPFTSADGEAGAEDRERRRARVELRRARRRSRRRRPRARSSSRPRGRCPALTITSSWPSASTAITDGLREDVADVAAREEDRRRQADDDDQEQQDQRRPGAQRRAARPAAAGSGRARARRRRPRRCCSSGSATSVIAAHRASAAAQTGPVRERVLVERRRAASRCCSRAPSAPRSGRRATTAGSRKCSCRWSTHSTTRFSSEPLTAM